MAIAAVKSIWSSDVGASVPRNAPIYSMPAEQPPQFRERAPEDLRHAANPWLFAKRSGNGYSDSGLTKSAGYKQGTRHTMMGLAEDAAPSKIPYIVAGAIALAAILFLRKK